MEVNMWLVDIIPYLLVIGVIFILLETLLPLFFSVLAVFLLPFAAFKNISQQIRANKNKSWLYNQSKLLSIINLILVSFFCFILHFYIDDRAVIFLLSLILTLISSAILYSIKSYWFNHS